MSYEFIGDFWRSLNMVIAVQQNTAQIMRTF